MGVGVRREHTKMSLAGLFRVAETKGDILKTQQHGTD